MTISRAVKPPFFNCGYLMIAIIDYGMGNLRSVQKAVEHVGAAGIVTADPREVERAEKVIFPGVGAFGDAMAELEKRRLTAPILESIKSGKPFLGICLGLQLLFESSQENPGVRGLGILSGTVEKFAGDFKIPHMGWNRIGIKNRACPILQDTADGTYLYFVHSYYVVPRDQAIAACTTGYGTDFVSMVWKDNIYATQFHPEKSQENGLKILKAFCNLK